MNPATILDNARAFAKSELGADASGHDWWHIQRVAAMAVKLASIEGADPFICELAALLHDIADEKLNVSKEAGLSKVRHWLSANRVEDEEAAHVIEIIAAMSYRGGSNRPMTTPEGRVVQDADRLDALGAIGIARTFAFAGSKGHLLHVPGSDYDPHAGCGTASGLPNTAIRHFYDKLLKLKDLMNTEYAAALALERHKYMEEYLAQFYAEWDSREGRAAGDDA